MSLILQNCRDEVRRDDDNEKISILIPAYNVESYIVRCLDSATKQLYENTEIVIIDDGSSDRTPQMIKEYINNNNNIRIYYEKHQGLSIIRNLLLEKASGDYLFFLDADDFLAPDALQILYDTAVKYQAEIVQCEMEDTSGDEISDHSDRGVTVYTRMEALRAYNRTGEGPRCMSAGKLYKKSIFDHIRYPEDGRTQEDEYVAFLALDACQRFVAVHRKLYGYFHNPNSIMRGKFSLDEYAAVEALQNSLKFFEEREIPEQVSRIRFRYLTILRCLYRKTLENFPQETGRLSWLREEYHRHLPLMLQELELPEEIRQEFTGWEHDPEKWGGINYWHYVAHKVLP